jgi:hypothetical protein
LWSARTPALSEPYAFAGDHAAAAAVGARRPRT